MEVNLDSALLNWMDDFAEQGILTTDTDLSVRGWNRWLELHGGRSRAEVLGRGLADVYPDLVDRQLIQFYQNALNGQAAVLAQRFHRYLLAMPATAGAGRFTLMQQSARIAPLYSGGIITGTITVIEDVTDRIAGEDALRQARDDLEVRVRERTAELAAAREQLRHLSRRLMEVQEEERRAIARELHDEAGQALTALMLGLGSIEREEACTPRIAARVAELKQATGGVLESLHHLAVTLRPASLDRVGLVPALTQYVESLQRQTDLNIDLVTVGLNGERLAPPIETTLYRVVQEALTNVVRHARARNVGVILQYDANRASAIVEDDGVGFDTRASGQPERLGLLGMRERVEMLGGYLTVESAPDRGTTIYAEVPAGPHG